MNAPLWVDRRRAGSTRGLERVWSDGTAFIPDLHEGDVADVTLVEGARVVARAVVRADARDVRLVWDDPGRFGVVVGDYPYRPWRGGPVATLRADGRDLASVSVAPDDASRSTIVTFDATSLPERVDVQVGPLADGRWALVRDVAPQGVLRVPAEAWQSARAVYGYVRAIDGTAPASGVAVVVTDGAGYSATARTTKYGRYHVPGAPRSALVVRVAGSEGSASVAVPAGDAAVQADLRLRD